MKFENYSAIGKTLRRREKPQGFGHTLLTMCFPARTFIMQDILAI